MVSLLVDINGWSTMISFVSAWMVFVKYLRSVKWLSWDCFRFGTCRGQMVIFVSTSQRTCRPHLFVIKLAESFPILPSFRCVNVYSFDKARLE